MLNREKLISYFKEKYKDNSMILNVLNEKTTEELQKIYNIEKQRKENKNWILENGTITYTIDFDEKLNKEIERFMWDHGMFTVFKAKINYRCTNDGRLTGVPVKFIEELENNFNIEFVRSREMYILGKKDIERFKIGDKVIILVDGILGNMETQGTIYDITDQEITIRKYRSKSKGYTFSVGDEVKIKKINKFRKVS